MRTLNPEEIEEVDDILRDRHPLYYADLKLSELFPFMQSWSWTDQKQSTHEESKKILPQDIERSDKFEKDQQENDKNESKAADTERSLHILGFGTVAYFDFHRYLIILYLIIVILLTPSLILFLFYGDGRRVGSNMLTKFSIGNIGFSSIFCKDITLHVSKLTLTWPTGVIRKVVSFGVIPTEAKFNDACMPNKETAECDSIIDYPTARTQIEEWCIDKEFCTIDARKLIKKDGPENWISEYSQFYTQVFWQHIDEEVEDRNTLNIWFSIQVLLTCLSFLGFLHFLRKQTTKEYNEWDMQTTTISDYTMMYTIPETVYKHFRDSIYPVQWEQHLRKSLSSGIMRQKTNRDDSPFDIAEIKEESLAFSFKLYLKNEFETILKDTEHVKFNDNSLIEISHIHLFFDHSRIHHLLVERGEALKNNNQALKERLEEQITTYIKENKEILSTPKEAYIIFESEEAYHRAMKFNLQPQKEKSERARHLKGTKISLTKIKEPTNMTFENKFKNPVVTLVKTIIVVALLTLALFLTCYMIFYFQSRINKLNRQYPDVNWENVIAHSSPEMHVNSAMFEYYNYEVSDKSDLAILMQNTDNLQCFWDKLVDDDGYINAMNKEFDVVVFDSHITGTVCNDYLKSAIFIQLTGILLPCMIILFNLLLKMWAILLVRWMKFENKTREIAFIQSVVFLLMFFNSALSILLINTNIPGLNPEGILFNGLYSDFSDNWYDKISQFFISPMFVQLIFPLNAFLPDYLIQKVLAILDRGFSDPKLYKTKWNIAYDYAELNSGTEHLLFEKYPRLLNIIFVSAFYGFNLPLLPILIFVSLIISYIFDKIVVAYYHRKPPLYDETLNVISIHFLKWASFLYIAIGYWVLTNKQMFGNYLRPIEYQAKIEDYDHKIFEIPDKIQQKILLIVALVILVYLIIEVLYHLLQQFFGQEVEEDDDAEFENLQPFHNALDDKALRFWVNEERHIRQRLGYKYLFDSFYQKLRDTLNEKNTARYVDINEADFKDNIWDSTNYDYLYLPQYSNQYAYIPVYKRKNRVLDNESNFTRKALDFPYHQQNSLSFYEAGMIQKSDEEEKKIQKRTIIFIFS